MYQIIMKHDSKLYYRSYVFKTRKELKVFLKDISKSNRQNEIASITKLRKVKNK